MFKTFNNINNVLFETQRKRLFMYILYVFVFIFRLSSIHIDRRRLIFDVIMSTNVLNVLFYCGWCYEDDGNDDDDDDA